MMLTGTHFNYYQLCHTKLWLFANGINMEHVSDDVYDGKLIHEGSYPQRPERYEEVTIEGVKVDYFDESQVKYYIYIFERNGIGGCTGLLEYPTMRQTMPVILTDEDRDEIRQMEKEISNIIESDVCPPLVKKRFCKSCSYYDFCFTTELKETE